jgi:fructose-1,6-bisphosphatase
VYASVSEEQAQLKVINPEGTYTVSYDPIDGNSVLDCNMSVASIYGIWRTKQISGCRGRDLIGAACTVYGSRTSMVFYNTQSQKVEELTLLELKDQERWIVTQPNIKIKDSGTLFSPGLRSCYDIPKLLDLFEQYSVDGYSLRHSGAMGLDCY